MKKTLSVLCVMTAVSLVSLQAHAEEGVQQSSRWSSSLMDRHKPTDSAQLQQHDAKKFRYMDMPQVKRSRSIRDAVIVYGPGSPDGVKVQTGQPDPHIQRPAQHARPAVILRPMT